MAASKPPSVTTPPPPGYEEVGESLAQAVAEGFRKLSWACEVAKLLGYQAKQVKAWIKHYEQQHAEELSALKRKQQRKQRRVERLRKKSSSLILEQGAES